MNTDDPDDLNDLPADLPQGDAAFDAGEPAPPEDDFAQPTGDLGDQPPQPTKMVPVAELVSERRRRQALEADLAALRQKETNERLARLEQERQPQPPQPEADPEPDYLDDPKGHYDWMRRQQARETAALQAEIKRLNEKIEGSTTATQQQAAVQQLTTQIAAHESGFIAEHPDYPQALTWLRQQRLVELQAIAGDDAPPDQLLAQLRNEELAVGWQALRRNENPAKLIYDLATRRGYRPQAQPDQPLGFPPASPLRSVQPGGRLPAGPPADTMAPPELAAAFAERFGRR